jgi:hypothetical protein
MDIDQPQLHINTFPREILKIILSLSESKKVHRVCKAWNALNVYEPTSADFMHCLRAEFGVFSLLGNTNVRPASFIKPLLSWYLDATQMTRETSKQLPHEATSPIIDLYMSVHGIMHRIVNEYAKGDITLDDLPVIPDPGTSMPKFEISLPSTIFMVELIILDTDGMEELRDKWITAHKKVVLRPVYQCHATFTRSRFEIDMIALYERRRRTQAIADVVRSALHSSRTNRSRYPLSSEQIEKIASSAVSAGHPEILCEISERMKEKTIKNIVVDGIKMLHFTQQWKTLNRLLVCKIVMKHIYQDAQFLEYIIMEDAHRILSMMINEDTVYGFACCQTVKDSCYIQLMRQTQQCKEVPLLLYNSDVFKRNCENEHASIRDLCTEKELISTINCIPQDIIAEILKESMNRSAVMVCSRWNKAMRKIWAPTSDDFMEALYSSYCVLASSDSFKKMELMLRNPLLKATSLFIPVISYLTHDMDYCRQDDTFLSRLWKSVYRALKIILDSVVHGAGNLTENDIPLFNPKDVTSAYTTMMISSLYKDYKNEHALTDYMKRVDSDMTYDDMNRWCHDGTFVYGVIACADQAYRDCGTHGMIKAVILYSPPDAYHHAQVFERALYLGDIRFATDIMYKLSTWQIGVSTLGAIEKLHKERKMDAMMNILENTNILSYVSGADMIRYAIRTDEHLIFMAIEREPTGLCKEYYRLEEYLVVDEMKENVPLFLRNSSEFMRAAPKYLSDEVINLCESKKLTPKIEVLPDEILSIILEMVGEHEAMLVCKRCYSVSYSLFTPDEDDFCNALFRGENVGLILQHESVRAASMIKALLKCHTSIISEHDNNSLFDDRWNRSIEYLNLILMNIKDNDITLDDITHKAYGSSKDIYIIALVTEVLTDVRYDTIMEKYVANAAPLIADLCSNIVASVRANMDYGVVPASCFMYRLFCTSTDICRRWSIHVMKPFFVPNACPFVISVLGDHEKSAFIIALRTGHIDFALKIRECVVSDSDNRRDRISEAIIQAIVDASEAKHYDIVERIINTPLLYKDIKPSSLLWCALSTYSPQVLRLLETIECVPIELVYRLVTKKGYISYLDHEETIPLFLNNSRVFERVASDEAKGYVRGVCEAMGLLKTIKDIPNEILSLILGELRNTNDYNSMNAAMKVCKHWNHLGNIAFNPSNEFGEALTTNRYHLHIHFGSLPDRILKCFLNHRYVRPADYLTTALLFDHGSTAKSILTNKGGVDVELDDIKTFAILNHEDPKGWETGLEPQCYLLHLLCRCPSIRKRLNMTVVLRRAVVLKKRPLVAAVIGNDEEDFEITHGQEAALVELMVDNYICSTAADDESYAPMVYIMKRPHLVKTLTSYGKWKAALTKCLRKSAFASPDRAKYPWLTYSELLDQGKTDGCAILLNLFMQSDSLPFSADMMGTIVIDTLINMAVRDNCSLNWLLYNGGDLLWTLSIMESIRRMSASLEGIKTSLPILEKKMSDMIRKRENDQQQKNVKRLKKN